jgi:hypothetical protein
MIKNNGGTTKLTTKNDTVTSEKTLTKEIVSIKGNDINNITNAQTFTNFLSRNNISETLSLSHPSQALQTGILLAQHETTAQNTSGELPSSFPEDILLISDRMLSTYPSLEQISTGEVNESVKAELGVQNETKLPSPDQDNVLKNSLNSFFLMNNLEKIYIALLEQNKEKAESHIKDLAVKINSVAKAFGEEHQSEATLEGIKTFILALHKKLGETYYIAPSYLAQLEKVANRCTSLATLSPGPQTADEAQAQWEIFVATLPANLQLK